MVESFFLISEEKKKISCFSEFQGKLTNVLICIRLALEKIVQSILGRDADLPTQFFGGRSVTIYLEEYFQIWRSQVYTQ